MADDIACGISAGIWLIVCVALALLPFRFHIPAPLCWALSILAYLLLFPHVTSTEELQLYLPLLLVFRARGAPDHSVWAMLILTTIALFDVKLALAALSILALRAGGGTASRDPASKMRGLALEMSGCLDTQGNAKNSLCGQVMPLFGDPVIEKYGFYFGLPPFNLLKIEKSRI